MKINKRILVVFFTLFHFFPTSGYAQVTLPKVFGDNMVLQRGINIPVWGKATPGSLIVATLGKVSTKAKADKDGKWMLHFPKFKAGGPYALKLSESEKPNFAIKLTGILIGDVWLASGQSNMEWQIQQARDAPNEIAKADFPQIRFLLVEHDIKFSPQSDFLAGKWKLCDTIM